MEMCVRKGEERWSFRIPVFWEAPWSQSGNGSARNPDVPLLSGIRDWTMIER